jgi:hypothetical protein
MNVNRTNSDMPVRPPRGTTPEGHVLRMRGLDFVYGTSTTILNRVSQLLSQLNLVNDHATLLREAWESGLIQQLRDAIDEGEALVAQNTEELDEISPEFVSLRHNLSARTEGGEAGLDLLYQVTFRWAGPNTQIADISTPAHPGDDFSGQNVCPICQASFTGHHGVVRLVCGHFFCEECLGSWVNSMTATCNICPLDRVELFTRRRREFIPPRIPRDSEHQRYRELRRYVGSFEYEIRTNRYYIELLCSALARFDQSQVAQSLGR